MRVPESVSPTRLELYGACGYRFFLSSLLRLRVPEQPRDAETIDPLVRGNLVHGALEDFFREQQAGGTARPPASSGRPPTRERLGALLDARLADARRRGLAGLPGVLPPAGAGAARRPDPLPPRGRPVPGRDGRRAPRLRDAHRRRGAGRPALPRLRRPRRPRSTWDVSGWSTTRPAGCPTKDAPARRGDPAAAAGLPAVGGRRLGGHGDVLVHLRPRGLRAGPLPGDGRSIRRPSSAIVAAISDGVARGSFPAVPGDFNEHYSEFENCRLCDFTRICSRARGVDFARKAADAGVAPVGGGRRGRGGRAVSHDDDARRRHPRAAARHDAGGGGRRHGQDQRTRGPGRGARRVRDPDRADRGDHLHRARRGGAARPGAHRARGGAGSAPAT